MLFKTVADFHHGWWTRASFVARLCNRFYFPGPNELDQVMGIICSMGPRWKNWSTALHVVLVIQAEVFVVQPHGATLPSAQRRPCGNRAGFDEGLRPQDPFCVRDLLDVSLAAAGPKKASSSSLNPADRRAILPLLRLAAEVGQNNIPQVEGGPVLSPSAPPCCQVPVFCLSG